MLPDLTNQTIDEIYLGAQAAAKQAGNVTIIEGGTSSTQPWVNACEGMVASKVDYLAYDSLDAQGENKCILDANAANIPAICIFACTTTAKNVATLTINFEGDGEMIGTWMGQELASKSSANVAVLQGKVGDEAASALVKGFEKTLASTCPHCKIVASVPGAGDNRDTAYSATLNVLTAHPDLQGLYSLNDDGAIGALQAVKQDNLNVLVAGHNGTCAAMQSILQGGMGFTVVLAGQPFGIEVVKLAQALAAGKTPTIPTIAAIPLSKTDALGYLNGSKPNPSGVNMKALLQTAQNGCKA